MAKFVPDVKTQRWIVISPSRQTRPTDAPVTAAAPVINHGCVFCEGNEAFTPPEIMRIGEGEPNKPGWKVRVVPNKFPITDTHEVIIHSPSHYKDIEFFDLEQVKLVLQVYKARFLAHLKDGHIFIFCNHGEQAGASLAHPHSQLVVIPQQINLDALAREPVMNVIEDHTNFITYCPDFSQWPYEVWISPKKEGTIFSEITDGELDDLASLLQRSLKRLNVKYRMPETKKLYKDIPFAYNFYIYHDKNWFIRIIPRLVHRAGFELGTGLNVNVVDPSIAAKELINIKVEDLASVRPPMGPPPDQSEVI